MDHSEQQIEVPEHEAEWVIVLERDPKARNAILVDKKNFKYKKLPLLTMDEWGSYLKNEIADRSGFSQ